MESTQLKNKIDQIIQSANKLLPAYLENPMDKGVSDGNVSICIIDENGQVSGKMWGEDKIRRRDTFQTAWRKASQVWITGVATGKYEELVFTNKIDSQKYRIQKPDFIGWEGGWPVKFDDEINLAVAVSGMRGENDTDLVVQAVTRAGGKVISK